MDDKRRNEWINRIEQLKSTIKIEPNSYGKK